MITTLIFDLDDTLLWDKKSVATAFRKTCEYAAKKYNVEASELEDSTRIEATRLYAGYETFEFTQLIGINPFEGLWGEFDDEGEYFQRMKEIVPTYRLETWTNGLLQRGIKDGALATELADLFRTERMNNPFVYEETFPVLERLKNNYKLVLLTNGSPSLQFEKLKITPEIAPYFEHIIISGEFGKGKPDPDIFEHVLKISNTKVDEALMIGDNLMTDILGASKVGMKSIWINREGKTPSGLVTPTYEIDTLEKLFPILKEITTKPEPCK